MGEKTKTIQAIAWVSCKPNTTVHVGGAFTETPPTFLHPLFLQVQLLQTRLLEQFLQKDLRLERHPIDVDGIALTLSHALFVVHAIVHA